MSDEPGRLYAVPKGLQTRWATAENVTGERGAGGKANGGRKGRPCVGVKAAGKAILAEVSGQSGMVRRIWLTINDRSPEILRGVRIDIYWDGAERPAVSAPLGDFFGVGFGRTAAFTSALFSDPEGRSFNCVVPMPFRKGMRIVVTNESARDLSMLFYEVDYTLGDRHDDDVLYFHAHWRRERANREKYLATWWGEGEVKVYLDGDGEWPTLCGSGTEDYIGTGWGQGVYAHPWQGCPIAEKEQMLYCFYRYHGPDPVVFDREARVAIQQIGWGTAEMQQEVISKGTAIYRTGPAREQIQIATAKRGVFEREGDDWSSCAYFYLDRPSNDLPDLARAEERMEGLGEVADTEKRMDT